MSKDITNPETTGHDPDNVKPNDTLDSLKHAGKSARSSFASLSSRNRKLLIAAIALVLVAGLTLFFWSGGDKPQQSAGVSEKAEHGDEHGEEHSDKHEANEVELSPEVLAAAKIETVEVSARPSVSLMRVTGTVEANQQQVQQVTPLISGRVEHVNVALGDSVRAGTVLAVISSPQVAEQHGKLHEAETRLELAERNLQRVQRTENRVSVLTAKAKLDESETTLRRTQRLVELGAGAGKDLVAAETAYKQAKAEYEFESNISLNREVNQARAEVETARVEVLHLKNGLRTFGANVSEESNGKKVHDISIVALTAPSSGTVTERLVNAGAGIEAGKPLFTIANLSTVWVIANVPESQVGFLREGTPAEIRAVGLGETALSGRVTYIDPLLNEETRTARVRIEVANPGARLKVGMFAEVGFQTAAGTVTGKELVVPEEAIQRIGERTVVFIPKQGEEGHFEAREIEVGGEVNGYRRITGGLTAGERVVTKGSFTLKTQMLKGEMGEHSH